MITRVRIEAYPGRRPSLAAEGGLAARLTGADRVHLVSAAATPVGDDEITVDVTVHAGAVLELTTVAATVVYPGRTSGRSTTRWLLTVGDGARLDLAPEPTIVAGGAAHMNSTELDLEPGGSARVVERVQLGRLGEPGGTWSGRLAVDLGGMPHLRHTVELAQGAAVPDRALLSAYEFPGTAVPLASIPPSYAAAVLPLERGGSLTTVTGHRVADLGDELLLARASL
ncbi:urease accessory protein UreD [Tsukamurella sp. 8F]|uniref:urease accessory protein UreD n=1 Tax=unclassified Tsukamurella TaxID=2633480 RepID=UPI0023B91F67|nr:MULTISPECIES: urease accessory protein UreD [unclassified Tsukamurella]MDF0529093.1 urease accessory protein UreD [Tsukamurella sp. 8J]MDF0589016.1 urease accessory protein UreD [Tsukamurella sp. 8F]